MRRIIVLLVCTLAACSGTTGGEGAQSDRDVGPTSTTEPATTTTLDPEAAFAADVDPQIDGGGMAEMLDLGWAICDAHDTVDEVSVDDAANDTPESDARIAEEAARLGLDVVMAEDLDDAVTEVIMREAGAELCPEHYGTITTYLAGLG
jgi:hypothetical protein